MLRKSQENMNYHCVLLRVLQLRSTFWKTLHKDFSIKSCQSKSSFKWFITIILSTYDERLHTLEVDKHAYLLRCWLAVQYNTVEENFFPKTTLLSFVMKGNKIMVYWNNYSIYFVFILECIYYHGFLYLNGVFHIINEPF